MGISTVTRVGLRRHSLDHPHPSFVGQSRRLSGARTLRGRHHKRGGYSPLSSGSGQCATNISGRVSDDDQVFRRLTLFLFASLTTTGQVIELTHPREASDQHHITRRCQENLYLAQETPSGLRIVRHRVGDVVVEGKCDCFLKALLRVFISTGSGKYLRLAYWRSRWIRSRPLLCKISPRAQETP